MLSSLNRDHDVVLQAYRMVFVDGQLHAGESFVTLDMIGIHVILFMRIFGDGLFMFIPLFVGFQPSFW